MMAVSVPNTIETPSAEKLSFRPYKILRFLLLINTPCASDGSATLQNYLVDVSDGSATLQHFLNFDADYPIRWAMMQLTRCTYSYNP